MPRSTRVGISWALLHALIVTALTWNWVAEALALCVVFYALLRPGEIVALMRSHILLPLVGDPLRPRLAIISVVKAKTRHRAARLQSVIIDDPLAAALLRHCLTLIPEIGIIVPRSGLEFRLRFASLLVAVGAQPLPLSPASLRPGGALFLFQRGGGGLLEVMFRGRWDNVRTLTHYL